MGISYKAIVMESPVSSQRSTDRHSDKDMDISDRDEFVEPSVLECYGTYQTELSENSGNDQHVQDSDNTSSKESKNRDNNVSHNDSVLELLSKVETRLREWKKVTICPECGEKIDKREKWRHMQKHIKTGYKCELCGKSFTRKSYLCKHMCKK